MRSWFLDSVGRPFALELRHILAIKVSFWIARRVLSCSNYSLFGMLVCIYLLRDSCTIPASVTEFRIDTYMEDRIFSTFRLRQLRLKQPKQLILASKKSWHFALRIIDEISWFPDWSSRCQIRESIAKRCFFEKSIHLKVCAQGVDNLYRQKSDSTVRRFTRGAYDSAEDPAGGESATSKIPDKVHLTSVACLVVGCCLVGWFFSTTCADAFLRGQSVRFFRWQNVCDQKQILCFKNSTPLRVVCLTRVCHAVAARVCKSCACKNFHDLIFHSIVSSIRRRYPNSRRHQRYYVSRSIVTNSK